MIAACLLLPTAGYAADAQPAESRPQDYVVAGFDAVILRPLGFVVVVVGAAFVIPVALFTWPTSDTTDAAVERFVKEPAHSVFERPLGEFES